MEALLVEKIGSGIIWYLICKVANKDKLILIIQTSMRLFFTRKELKLRRKRTIAGIVCLALVAGIYWILTRPHKVEPEVPTVIVEPAERDNVEIFGEYVGRIRAQQFVEVRARVEGYLEVCSLPRGRM